MNIRLVLPSGLTCNRCVFQWRYHTGNSWGVDPVSGQGGLGEGAQEEFYGCSDIKIGGSGSVSFTTFESTNKPSTQHTTQPPTQTTDSFTGTNSQSTSFSLNKCSNGDGFYSDLSSACTKFYRCIAGVVFNYNCPSGTLFDKNINAC
ncbi:unnamed protein product, partial [Brachionus calyciflorus]